MDEKLITVKSRKFDGSIHRQWDMRLKKSDGWFLELVGQFAAEINHPQLGVIRRGTISCEFFWMDKWFNVFRFHEPDGSPRNFYCNVIMPPVLCGDVLNYIDLDVDIVVWKDFSYQVLDLDEFAENARRFDYPSEVHLKVKSVLEELIAMIEKRIFPFDYKF